MPGQDFADIYSGLTEDERRAVDEAAAQKMRTLIGNKLKGLPTESTELEEPKPMTEAELRAAELAELAPLRGDLGERAQRERARINSKYQGLRYGERPTDPSLEYLRLTREAKAQGAELPPDGSPQSVLMAAYAKEVAKLRPGNIRAVSNLQASFRRRGLKI